MAAEMGALFGEFSVRAEREYLKTAAVGENRSLPAVELVQAAGLFYDFHAGAQIQVVGVAEYNLGIDFVAQFVRMHAFDSAYGAYRHEDRRFNRAMVGFDKAGAGVAIAASML